MGFSGGYSTARSKHLFSFGSLVDWFLNLVCGKKVASNSKRTNHPKKGNINTDSTDVVTREVEAFRLRDSLIYNRNFDRPKFETFRLKDHFFLKNDETSKKNVLRSLDGRN